MDRRQRKREKNKKKRELAKKARAALVRRPDPEERLLRAATRSPFGPCYISAGWKVEEGMPQLVSVVVTRRLPDGDLVYGTALVDRTCLGIETRSRVTRSRTMSCGTFSKTSARVTAAWSHASR